MKRLVALCMLLLPWLVVMGQTNVEFVGSSVGCEGKTIALYGYDNMLTQTEVELDRTTIDPNGNFRLACYANYPRLVFLQVERYSQSFYIEAGRRYEVYIPQFDWDLDEKQNVFLSPVALPVEFVNIDSNELNLRIMRFEAAVDSFLAANEERLDFRFRPDRRVFDTLRMMVDRRFRTEGDEETFFGRYVEFTLQQMRLAMRMDKRQRIVDKYVSHAPIRYHDETYMRLFFALFEHSIAPGTRRVGLHRLVDWVSEGNLAAYLDSVGLDPLLQNEQVRELAVLQALRESFYDKNYPREGVRQMVQLMANGSKFDEHRQLAQRLLESFSRVEQGEELPRFVLPDVEHRSVGLDDLRGKWVYLNFVRVGDPNCLKEIETMAHFRDSVYAKHEDVVFVSVSCDREFQKMYHFLKNNKRGSRYNWTWLHFNGNYRLLEAYGVVSYPTFLLINPEGRLHYTVTPPPASGILLHGPWEKPAELKDYSKPFFGN